MTTFAALVPDGPVSTTKPVIRSEWVVVRRWTFTPPEAGDWAFLPTFEAQPDAGTTGEVRFRVIASGVTSTVATVTTRQGSTRLGWVDLGADTTGVVLEVRRTAGTGGIRVYAPTHVLVGPIVATTSTPPVTITDQPDETTITTGQTATFAVTAVGNGPLTYQWYKAPPTTGDAQPVYAIIAGATARTYTTPALTVSDSGTRYRVVVSDGATSATSTGAMVRVAAAGTAPVVTSDPAPAAVPSGTPATFQSTATGWTTATWEYRKAAGTPTLVDASRVTNAPPTTEYTTNPVGTWHADVEYRAVFTNTYGTTYSAWAGVTIGTTEPPTEEPQPGADPIPSSALKVQVKGSTPISQLNIGQVHADGGVWNVTPAEHPLTDAGVANHFTSVTDPGGSGKTVLKLRTSKTSNIDSGGSLRTEIKHRSNGATWDYWLRKGSTYWVTGRYRMSERANRTNGHISPMQIHIHHSGTGVSTNPPIACYLRGSTNNLVARHDTGGGTYKEVVTKTYTQRFDTWINLIIQVRMTETGTGLFKMWEDGVLLVDYTGPLGYTGASNSEGYYFNFGQYFYKTGDFLAAGGDEDFHIAYSAVITDNGYTFNQIADHLAYQTGQLASPPPPAGGGSTSYRGAYSIRTGTSATVNASSLSTPPVNGDTILFMTVGNRPSDGGVTLNGPTGATLVAKFQDANAPNAPVLGFWQKTYAGEASWTWGVSNAGIQSATFGVIAFVGAATIVAGTEASNPANGTTVDWNGLTVAAGDVAVAVFTIQDYLDAQANGTVPTGGTAGAWNQRIYEASGSRALFAYTKASAGGTEDATISLANGDWWRSVLLKAVPS